MTVDYMDDIIPLLKDKLDKWLATFHGHRAVDLGKKECQRCGWCCAVRPCIPTPEELRWIADYLGLSLKDAVQKCFVFDEFQEVGPTFIAPARATQLDLAGHMLSSYRTYDGSLCVFYDQAEHRCRLQAVKPLQARLIRCWDKDCTHGPMATLNAVLSWKDIVFEEYVGFTPEKRKYSGV